MKPASLMFPAASPRSITGSLSGICSEKHRSVSDSQTEAAVSASPSLCRRFWMKEAGETDLVPEGRSVLFTFHQEFFQSAPKLSSSARRCKPKPKGNLAGTSAWGFDSRMTFVRVDEVIFQIVPASKEKPRKSWSKHKVWTSGRLLTFSPERSHGQSWFLLLGRAAEKSGLTWLHMPTSSWSRLRSPFTITPSWWACSSRFTSSHGFTRQETSN